MIRKFADASNHKNITDCKFTYEVVDTEEFKGSISVIKIKSVKKDWILKRNTGTIDCILAPNYTWVQIYPDNKNFAITAMYNEKKEPMEWYFDIIKSSGIINNVPYIDDMYLDVVLTHENQIEILDEDELEQALDEKDITIQDYNVAKKTCNDILEYLKYDENKLKLKNFSAKYLDILGRNI